MEVDKQVVEMTFENRYKMFSFDIRAKYICELYEPYKVRGVQEDVLKGSPKYQYPHDRKEGYLLSQGVDKKGYYAIFLPTENEYEKIKVFAEINEKLVKLSELANLQRQLTARNKTLSELNSIEKKIDELYINVFDNEILSNANPFPEVFKGDDNTNYLVFKSYTEKYVIDKYADYSFLFQKMKKDNRLHSIQHFYFMKWLKKNIFITEKTFDEFVRKGTFSTKYSSANRLNNYLLVLNDINQSISE